MPRGLGGTAAFLRLVVPATGQAQRICSELSPAPNPTGYVEYAADCYEQEIDPAAVAGVYLHRAMDQARQAAESALPLVRQQVLFGGFYKIYLDQVMFGLYGKYTFREGGQYASAGWWRKPRPFPVDFT